MQSQQLGPVLLGKGEVVCSIHTGSTISLQRVSLDFLFRMRSATPSTLSTTNNRMAGGSAVPYNLRFQGNRVCDRTFVIGEPDVEGFLGESKTRRAKILTTSMLGRLSP